MTETDINSEILIAVSHLPNTLAFRNNSGLLFARSGARVRASVNGAPDIIVIHKGRFVGLETKSPSGRQRKSQENFQNSCEKAGGIYAIVRSAADALAVLGEIA